MSSLEEDIRRQFVHQNKLAATLDRALTFLADCLADPWDHQEQSAGVCKYDCLACARRRELWQFIESARHLLAHPES